MTRLDVTARFDGGAAWDRLSEQDRRSIGAALLELEAAESLSDRAADEEDERLARVAFAALDAADRALIHALSALGDLDLDTPAGQPRIPSSLGMVCEVCGCSEDQACPGGCAWARQDLCTSCIGREA